MSATWLGKSCGVSVRQVSSYRPARCSRDRRADHALGAGDEDAACSHAVQLPAIVQARTYADVSPIYRCRFA